MTPRLRNPAHRIALAIVISALVHALVLWLPHIRLPRFENQLPPLAARLEPLPNIDKLQPSQSKPKPKPKAAAVATLPSSKPAPISAASAVAEAVAASAVAVAEAVAASAPAATETPAAATTVLQSPLPRHAQLSFSVRRGTDGFHVGEVQHRLDIVEGRYTIEASTRTTGIARWFKSYNLNQKSSGTESVIGLRPESFSEEKNDSGNRETLSADFDWNAHLLHFSSGTDASLNVGVQDSLSILYQLSLLPLRAELLRVSISNGKKLENYTLEISTSETLPTAMGELHVVHLRKLHPPGEAGLEIWLAREYRLLPVKIQYFEPDGTVGASIIITDIRVSDE